MDHRNTRRRIAILMAAGAMALTACGLGSVQTPSVPPTNPPSSATASASKATARATETEPEQTPTPRPLVTATPLSATPTPTPGPLGRLLEFKMVSNLAGWVLNDARHVLVTRDGASTWVDVTPDLGGDVVESVSFLTPEQARISVITPGEITQDPSRFRILSTQDGGTTWNSGETPRLMGEHVAGLLYFVDPTNGWYQISSGVGGMSCGYFLLATTDGGATWELRSALDLLEDQATTPKALSACAAGFSFLDAMVGWAVGSYYADLATYFYRTGDGGRTWDLVQLGQPISDGSDAVCAKNCVTYPPAFSTDRDGFLVTLSSGEARPWTTHDSGQTWSTSVPFPGFACLAQSAESWDRRQGWLVLEREDGGHVLGTTSDGGDTWSIRRNALLADSLLSIDPAGQVWMASQGRIWASPDGGSNLNAGAESDAASVPAVTPARNGWTRDERISISAAQLDGKTEDEIAVALMEKYLAHYVSEDADSANRLLEYKDVVISPFDESYLRSLAKDNGATFARDITYSVKPYAIDLMMWVAGNGDVDYVSSWVTRKSLLVTVTLSNGEYVFTPVGTG